MSGESNEVLINRHAHGCFRFAISCSNLKPELVKYDSVENQGKMSHFLPLPEKFRGGVDIIFRGGVDIIFRGGVDIIFRGGVDIICRGGVDIIFRGGVDIIFRGGVDIIFRGGVDIIFMSVNFSSLASDQTSGGVLLPGCRCVSLARVCLTGHRQNIKACRHSTYIGEDRKKERKKERRK